MVRAPYLNMCFDRYRDAFTISLKHFFFLIYAPWEKHLNPPPVFINRRRLWRQRTSLSDKKACISFRPFWQLTHFIAFLTAFL